MLFDAVAMFPAASSLVYVMCEPKQSDSIMSDRHDLLTSHSNRLLQYYFRE